MDPLEEFPQVVDKLTPRIGVALPLTARRPSWRGKSGLVHLSGEQEPSM